MPDAPLDPTRRALLQRAAWATAGLSLGGLPALGCAGKPTAPDGATDAVAGVWDAAPSTDAGVFTALRSSLDGQLLVPGDTGFAAAARTFHVAFDHVQPAAIARCASDADVQRSVDWARAAKIPLRIRSGGHSYAGYCKAPGALVLDLRAMSAVSVNSSAAEVTVGAGATLIDVQAALWPLGLALPTGSCPTVGIAGLALGGGYGLISRRFGLTCDTLRAVDVVLADGRLVTADAVQHPDLFWACRGGGGGNFGVVTRLTFGVTPVDQAATLVLRWPWSQAAQVVVAWLRWAPSAPNALTANLHLKAGGEAGGEPTVRVVGAWVGALAGAKAQLTTLEAAGAPKVAKPIVEGGDYGQVARGWVDCDAVVAHCRLTVDSPAGQVARGTYHARSDFIDTLMPTAGIAALLKAVEARASAATPGMVLLDPHGGAIGEVPANATAFVHRDTLFSAQYLAFGTAESPASAKDPWLTTTYAAMRPYASGGVYQNYIDADLAGWQSAYYGSNLKRLQQVKATYDPDRLFDFPQAVT